MPILQAATRIQARRIMNIGVSTLLTRQPVRQEGRLEPLPVCCLLCKTQHPAGFGAAVTQPRFIR
jgi:hypothetical protein